MQDLILGPIIFNFILNSFFKFLLFKLNYRTIFVKHLRVFIIGSIIGVITVSNSVLSRFYSNIINYLNFRKIVNYDFLKMCYVDFFHVRKFNFLG